MHRRDQRGSSLILVLAVIAFLGLLLPPLLGLALTGSRVTMSVAEDRSDRYVAFAGLDAAIEHARTARDSWVGRQGEECPNSSIEVDGITTKVECESNSGPLATRRCIKFYAYLGANLAATAEVEYLGQNPSQATIHSWDPSPPGRTPPDPSWCLPPGSPTTTTTTTTTSTTTTSTTTTTVPVSSTVPPEVPVLSASWSTPNATRVANEWRAASVLTVKDFSGAVVEGATARVTVAYQRGGVWLEEPAIEDVTNASGEIEFQSLWYRRNGQDVVTRIRFTVVVIEFGSTAISPADLQTSVAVP